MYQPSNQLKQIQTAQAHKRGINKRGRDTVDIIILCTRGTVDIIILSSSNMDTVNIVFCAGAGQALLTSSVSAETKTNALCKARASTVDIIILCSGKAGTADIVSLSRNNTNNVVLTFHSRPRASTVEIVSPCRDRASTVDIIILCTKEGAAARSQVWRPNSCHPAPPEPAAIGPSPGLRRSGEPWFSHRPGPACPFPQQEEWGGTSDFLS